ncbi:unnamed protein product [Aureobasidium mustum]|uniref:Uncharacterized protein n=1 Tax=Aureobasidium mustum TaxID=2773714 RepID=A0A9N8K3Q7_9PEZI|nr:unnamed protein product [Aureobasidium mustum]
MIDAWFENTIEKGEIDGEGCRREEAMTLRAYLRNEITVDEASQQITQPTEKCPEPGDPLLYLWGVLQDAMLEVPGAQPKIVKLLLRIQTRPDIQLEESQRVGALSDKQWTHWRDLPHFGHDWYDLHWWYYCSFWRLEPDKYSTPDADTLAKTCTIASADAQLAVAGLLSNQACFEGLVRLAATLEDNSAIFWIELPAMKEWLVNGGDMLFEMSRVGKTHRLLRDFGDLRKQENSLWKGDAGASLQRWHFWKERLRQIQDDNKLGKETREAAKISLELMEQY